VETIVGLQTGTISPIPQDDSQATMAPMLKKEDGALDWRSEAGALANRIRGLTPWPGAYTYYGEERWQIWRAQPDYPGCASAEPGTILEVSKEMIRIACGKGSLVLQELQPASGKRLTIGQYLAGHAVRVGATLTSPPPGAPA
jgi:methionyl-tRNA formyltransferase